jgi:DNA ligase D-like protein (predicted 3'-phosphoesterase)
VRHSSFRTVSGPFPHSIDGYHFGMRLSEYRRKRRRADTGPRFVIHTAGSDHYDLGLEVDGALVSWAIRNDRRMARRTEDQPLDCVACGATVWDRGTYANVTRCEMTEGLRRGYLSFRLRGEKLRGDYTLTRVREGDEETWLLIGRRDEDADAPYEPGESQPESVPPGQAPDEADESS